MKNAISFHQKFLVVAGLVSVSVMVGAAVTTAPNNAVLGTAIPPTAFPNPIAPSVPPNLSPPGLNMGLNPVQPNQGLINNQTMTQSTTNPAGGATVNPDISIMPGQSGVVGPSPIPTPTCTDAVYGEPCVPQ